MTWTDYSSSPPHGTRICPAAEITAVHPLTVTTERGDFPLILLRDHTPHKLTTETPTSLPMRQRVAAHHAALAAIVEHYRSKQG